MSTNQRLKTRNLLSLLASIITISRKVRSGLRIIIDKNQDEAAFLSVGEMAKRLELSEATMVRFARTSGLESYPAFRVVLQEAFRRRVTHSGRLRSRLNDLREAGDIFEKLVVSEIDYLTQAFETVDRNELKRAVELIQSHPRIFVFGLGPSITLVDLLDIRLTRSTKHVIPLKSFRP